jgi:hypothetical protein
LAEGSPYALQKANIEAKTAKLASTAQPSYSDRPDLALQSDCLGHLDVLACAARWKSVAALVAERMMQGFQ